LGGPKRRQKTIRWLYCSALPVGTDLMLIQNFR
jgi:hypothetical protein